MPQQFAEIPAHFFLTDIVEVKQIIEAQVPSSRAFETVPTETPAFLATSFMVAMNPDLAGSGIP